jgi:hypothetical protein
MKVKIESIKKKSIDIRRIRNWNEQYSRKKNMKIDYCEERRGYITSYVVQIDDGPFTLMGRCMSLPSAKYIFAQQLNV